MWDEEVKKQVNHHFSNEGGAENSMQLRKAVKASRTERARKSIEPASKSEFPELVSGRPMFMKPARGPRARAKIYSALHGARARPTEAHSIAAVCYTRR